MPKTPFERNGKMCEVVRRERNKLGLTQEQLADMIGVQKNTIGLIERDKTGMRRRTAADLMRIFECDEIYLLGESPYKTKFERAQASVSEMYDAEMSHYRIVSETISIIGWKPIGAAGIVEINQKNYPCFATLGGNEPTVYDAANDAHLLQTESMGNPQYYIFDTPDGKRAIPCMEYVKFMKRFFSYLESELQGLTTFVPALSGWEHIIPTDPLGFFEDDTLIRLYEKSEACASKSASSEEKKKPKRKTRQQDNEKGEEQ